LDPSLTSGGIIATIGIGTVFFALVTLIGVVTAMARLSTASAPEPEPSAAPLPKVPASAAAGDSVSEKSEAPPAEAPEPDFQRIALSAYAYHRRTTTRVKGDTPSTSWDVAGRIHELRRRTASSISR
jgi:Na+-transporting methylmalonyl-CoA/oxaloacetate decarboxylase gamma subunit